MSRVRTSLWIAVVATSLAISAGVVVVDAVRTDGATSGRIVELAAHDNRAMQHLGYLAHEIGARPADSYEALVAARWARDELRGFGLENVHLELVGEIKGYFPDDATSDRYRQLYRTMFDTDPDLERIPIFNVVADLPGSELPYEYVIVGGHLDSTSHGDGATDNGTGVAAVMEAARLLVGAAAEPRRTIRFVLFGGEEAGLVGSRAYVEDHPEVVPATSAVYIMDRGTDYISGILATDPLEADLKRAFERAARLDPDMPFRVAHVDYLPRVDPTCGAPATQILRRDVDGGPRLVKSGGCGTARGASEPPGKVAAKATGSCATARSEPPSAGDGTKAGEVGERRIVIAGPDGVVDADDVDLEALGLTPEMLEGPIGTKRKVVMMGSSDHAPFLAAGIPAFFLKQDGTPGLAYPAHTGDDTLDNVVARYVEHSATVLALGALGTANIDHMLSRERLEAPDSEQPGGSALATDLERQGSGSARPCGGSTPG